MNFTKYGMSFTLLLALSCASHATPVIESTQNHPMERIMDNESQSRLAESKLKFVEGVQRILALFDGTTTFEQQEASHFFDEIKPFYPKRPPLTDIFLMKKDIFFISLTSPQDMSYTYKTNTVWDVAYISPERSVFEGGKMTLESSILEGEMNLKLISIDFTESPADNRHRYSYKYQWNQNKDIEVIFGVAQDDFIEGEETPKNFYRIEIRRK